MSDEKPHIPSNSTYAIVGIIILFLTGLNISIAMLSHAKWMPGIIVLVSSVQAFIALTWFMHLRWDSKITKILVAGVFVLYAVVIALTFLDYSFR